MKGYYGNDARFSTQGFSKSSANNLTALRDDDTNTGVPAQLQRSAQAIVSQQAGENLTEKPTREQAYTDLRIFSSTNKLGTSAIRDDKATTAANPTAPFGRKAEVRSYAKEVQYQRSLKDKIKEKCVIL